MSSTPSVKMITPLLEGAGRRIQTNNSLRFVYRPMPKEMIMITNDHPMQTPHPSSHAITNTPFSICEIQSPSSTMLCYFATRSNDMFEQRFSEAQVPVYPVTVCKWEAELIQNITKLPILMVEEYDETTNSIEAVLLKPHRHD